MPKMKRNKREDVPPKTGEATDPPPEEHDPLGESFYQDEPEPGAPEEEGETVEIELSDEAIDYVRQIEAERDEAVAARQRSLADFSNFQRRAVENEFRATQDGVGRVVRTLLPVLDHFDLALGQEIEQLTVEQLFDGMKMVRQELLRALETHGVERIAPAPGDEFDPMRHEAMMRQAADDIEPNHIVSVMQNGYALGDLVLRPAKVAVAPGND
jgi:molecular chaperone GrpE